MAKFDVYRDKVSSDYLLDCQTDLLSTLNTRLVVPLRALHDAPRAAARLNPIFEIGGEPLVMVTQYAASVPVSELGIKVVSLADHDLTIGNALDMLISGF
jgi:toxin CcdB